MLVFDYRCQLLTEFKFRYHKDRTYTDGKVRDMIIEKDTFINNLDENEVFRLHDAYGRCYQARLLSSFADYTLIPHLFRFRHPHLLRCLGINNTDNLPAESVSGLRTGLLINQVKQIDIKESPDEVVVLFEHLSALTLRQFSLQTITLITKEISELYESFFDQIQAALVDFADLSGVGLWHGDMSPDNIMITGQKQAILIDFDKSKIFLPGYNSFIAEHDCNKKTIRLSGTPGYTSKLALKEQGALDCGKQYSFNFIHNADRESLGRSFVAALLKKPGSTLTAADIKSVLSQVQPGFAYKLLSALCAGV